MILATNNKNKIKEIKQILLDYDIKSLSEVNISVDVEEDQNTFYGNASKKAKEIFELANEPVIADDSGICIDAFEGWPGVLTHRFLGEDASDKDRNLAIINKMDNLKGEERKASVACSLVLFDGHIYLEGKGNLRGYIVTKPRGENGFGFDEIFEISDIEFDYDSKINNEQKENLEKVVRALKGKTLAELTAEEKNQISARYIAALDLKNKIESYERKGI